MILILLIFSEINAKYYKYSENYKPIRHSEPEKIMSEKAENKAVEEFYKLMKWKKTPENLEAIRIEKHYRGLLRQKETGL